ncbi:MAG: hypothetical protein MI757_19350 [Pirellulales bacterium]|nr:hypothetical protein [Pirellulales bacterium]
MRTRWMRHTLGCLLVTLVAVGTACNKADEGTPQTKTGDDSSGVVQATHQATATQQPHASDAIPNEVPAPAATTPNEAITNFLEAVRRGDDGQAEALLSEMAREKTRAMDLAVAPPGSPTAKFEVGATEFPYDGAETAHVASTWSDIDGSGYERTDEIVWILRKETGGWRIAGMATKLFEDQPPLILNFEDPQDMIRKQKAAEAEIDRRNAENPAASGATGVSR